MSETRTLTLAIADGAGYTNRSIPRRLGPVVLEGEIGRGAAGVVFRGRHEILGRDVAVKLLLHATSREADCQIDRFRAEARAAAAVRHPHLTMIHHADVADGVPYLVMDYIDGPSISALLRRHGRLPIDAALAVAMAMSEAVAALHHSDLVHRDIKPRNTLLDRDGHVFVTDFGLALVRTRLGSITAPSGVLGTPAYMAPEMFDGTASARSDVYALGITLFELIGGRPPFDGTLPDFCRHHAATPLPLAALENLGVPSAVVDVVERATHKNATYRYKTAEHLGHALEAVCTAEQRAAGQGRLKDLAGHFDAAAGATSAETFPDTPTTSYFDVLGEMANHRRHQRTPESTNDAPTTGPTPFGFIPSGDASVGVEGLENVIDLDIPCVRCSYNLRGLSPDSRCPECGERVVISTRPPRLLFSGPRWLGRVQLGLTMIQVAPLVMISSGLFIDMAAPFGAAMARVGSHLFVLLGLFLTTSRDTQVTCSKRVQLFRVGARMAACLALLDSVLHVLRTWDGGGRPLGTMASGPVAEAGECAAAAALLLWLASLAGRNRDVLRYRRARLMVWALTISGVLAGSQTLLPDQIDDDLIRWGASAAVGAYLVAWVGLWLLTGSFRTMIREERRVALSLMGAARGRALSSPTAELLLRPRRRVEDGRQLRGGDNDPRKILHLRRCPRCGYDIHSLPRRHRCPECGFEYDERMFCLYGWSYKDRFSASGRLFLGRWYERLFALMFFALFAMLFCTWIAQSWTTRAWSFPILLYLVLWGAIGRLRSISLQFKEAGTRGNTQLLCNAEGVSICRGPGEAPLIPWKRIRRLRVRRLRFRPKNAALWRITLNPSFWRITLRSDPMDFILESTPRQAALVRRELRRRIRAAKWS